MIDASPFIAMLFAFVLGFVFPVGKVSRKIAFVLYGGYLIIYIVLVASNFYFTYNRSQELPVKFDYTDPGIVLWVSTIGAFILLFPGIVLYIIGSFLKYIYLLIKKQWIH